MSPLLLFLLAFYQFQTLIQSELLNGPTQLNSYTDNQNDIDTIIPNDIGDESNENDVLNEMPLIRTGQDGTQVEFRQPIKSVNIDYSKNSIELKFQKQQRSQRNHDDEMEKYLSATDFMRFGKRAYESEPNNENGIHQLEQKNRPEKSERYERSSENSMKNGNVGIRDSRGDNFMRFGRNSADFMRFGRSPADFMRLERDPGDFMRFGRNPGQDFMRFGRAPADFMRLGRDPGQDFMRFGRAPADFMRLGRDPGQDFMRFGRAPADFMRLGRDPSPGQDFMRFGRSPPGQDFMRFGRAQSDFMRFGRSPPGQDFMRFGRSPADFMRLGRSNEKYAHNTDRNFMRFGRLDNFMRLGRSSKDLNPNDGKQTNHTTATLDQKNEIKAMAKVIHDSRKNNDDGNPMDKAIQVLFNKQNADLPKSEEGNDASEAQDYRR